MNENFYTVEKSAQLLDLTPGRVRQMLRDGILDGHKPETGDRGWHVSRESVEELRGQLEAERRANDENRRLLLRALDRIPPQLEAPEDPEQPRERRREVRGKGPVPHDRETAAEPRPWWRKVFAG